MPRGRHRIAEAARRPLVVVCDDAYAGLVFEPGIAAASPFWDLAGAHPNLIPLKVDGATKEPGSIPGAGTSAGEDRTIRLWPMPEGPPFHLLPREELLDRLRALTNYRVVPDGRAPAGYRLDMAPFPGWERVPAW